MPFDDTVITCPWVRERVDDYVDGADGGLAPEERAAVARHAGACASCRAEIDAADAVLRELRAFPLFEAPDAVIAGAQSALAGERVLLFPGRSRGPAAIARWIPAAAAAAAIIALVATARWSDPVRTARGSLAEARVERAARETFFALSYVNRYARMTGRIVTTDVIEKRLVGTMERAVDREVMDRGVTPPLRRAMGRSGIVETESPLERS
ncbi:MAG TPA: zf-HC2 domain-containing protein [Candidatus Krumholzibacteria bacterium]|nr:zf-HC2 domain-containing protein [Candidatus Krumholzibacteria bacterium]